MNESKVLLSIVDELINHHENTIKTLNKLRSHLEDEKEVEQESSKEEKSYSKEDVRAILSEKSAAGFGKEVKALLQKHGADKLSTLTEESYSEVVKEAQEIGHA